MRRTGTAVVLSGKHSDHVSYCQDCLKVKILSPLKHRIDDGKLANPGPDADKWRQCWQCGVIVGIYEAKQEVELDTLTEPRDNPFKFGNTQVRTGELRKVDRSGITQRKRKFKQDLEHTKKRTLNRQ